eukprot:GDKJ01002751.1.p1 GENE.GDKJ01002751.1~~GDKJ01002751.1.p1  ORF type:complete len:388 (-),score=75.76 GDKJ01002751.1:93-1256(-)
MRSFDGFSKPPSELRVKTHAGGFLTLLSIISACVLFCMELHAFLNYELVDSMKVDSGRTASPITWGANIDLPSVPCEKLTFSIYDGKTNAVNPFTVSGIVSLSPLIDGGCKFTSDVTLPKLDYRILLSSSDYVPYEHSLISTLQSSLKKTERFVLPMEGVPRSLPSASSGYADFEHSISSFSLGTAFPTQESPLDGIVASATRHARDNNKRGLFVLRASYKVHPIETDYHPANLLGSSGKSSVIKSYQYGAGKPEVKRLKAKRASHFTSDKTTPGVNFSFDPVAFTVTKEEVKMTLLKFIIRCCAVVGGVLASTRMLDLVVHSVVERKYVHLMDLSRASDFAEASPKSAQTNDDSKENMSHAAVKGKKLQSDDDSSDDEALGFAFQA